MVIFFKFNAFFDNSNGEISATWRNSCANFSSLFRTYFLYIFSINTDVDYTRAQSDKPLQYQETVNGLGLALESDHTPKSKIKKHQAWRMCSSSRHNVKKLVRRIHKPDKQHHRSSREGLMMDVPKTTSMKSLLTERKTKARISAKYTIYFMVIQR